MSQIGKGLPGNATYIPVVLKKKILEYFSTYFYDLNLEPPGTEPSWNLGPSYA